MELLRNVSGGGEGEGGESSRLVSSKVHPFVVHSIIVFIKFPSCINRRQCNYGNQKGQIFDDKWNIHRIFTVMTRTDNWTLQSAKFDVAQTSAAES